LETANVDLREANALKTAFIKVASHELRTPLTIILGLADLARQTPGLAEPLAHWVERIYAAGQRLNGQVDQMLKLLLADRFERPVVPEDVDLGAVLRQAAADVATFAQWRHQRLDVLLPAQLGQIVAEADKVRDSVSHLLLNAVKFTPDGGTIRITARRLA